MEPRYNILVYYAQEESVIIKIIDIIVKEKPWNNFYYSSEDTA